nr:MAG TPA: hypothetical protein [Bacteriophage sp.]
MKIVQTRKIIKCCDGLILDSGRAKDQSAYSSAS